MSHLVNRIIRYNAGRNLELIDIKHKQIRKNLFAFLRKICHLFYEDWPTTSPLNSTPQLWGCGDLHLQNFGMNETPRSKLRGICFMSNNS
jgi:uncharacterized protein (DUF2252 family)